MVRVLIERHIAEGMVEEFRLALGTMRGESSRKPGYISGESLQNRKDPHHYFVLSTWKTAEDWHNWEKSEARLRMMAAIGPMLEEPEHIVVMEPI